MVRKRKHIRAKTPDEKLYNISGNAVSLTEKDSKIALRPPLLGMSEVDITAFDSMSIPQKDILTIVLRYLSSLGFDDAVDLILKRSGDSFDSALPDRFCELILHGNFAEALDMCPKVFSEETAALLGNIKSLIVKHWFYEIVARGNHIEALKFLREHIREGDIDIPDPFTLLLPVMFPQGSYIPNAFLEEQEGFSGVRSMLLTQIHKLAPWTIKLDKFRLEALMKYAVLYQFNTCPLHSPIDISDGLYSIFNDHVCDWDSLPICNTQTIDYSKKCVSNVAFNRSGKYFATCTRDRNVALFQQSDLNKIFVSHKTLTFATIVSGFSWSPDGNKLLVLVAAMRFSIYVYYLHGMPPDDLIQLNTVFNETISCLDWFPDSEHYVTGSMEGNVVVSKLTHPPSYMTQGYRTNALKVLSNGKAVLIADQLKRIMYWDLETRTISPIWQEEELITSMSLCPDDDHVLLATKNRGILLFSLLHKTVLRSFSGVKQQLTIMEASFMPGKTSKLFACGSESIFVVFNLSLDGFIYFFHINRPAPIKMLAVPGSTSAFSCSWCPADPGMMLTSTESGKIHVWKSKAYISNSVKLFSM